MAEFNIQKTDEEIEEEEEDKMESEIRQFLVDVDKIMRMSRRIPASNYIRFDPFLFFAWKNYKLNERRQNE